MSQELRFHPLADLFPLMDGEEFDALVADIKANDLYEDIVLYDGMILDGRNRYRACLAAGWHPEMIAERFVVGATMLGADRWIDDPVAYVISANIHRRQLTRGQKREIIAKLIKAQPEKSNSAIAKELKITSDKTVAAVRAELESTSEIPKLEKTTGKDGKARKRPVRRKAASYDAPTEKTDELPPSYEGPENVSLPETSAKRMKDKFAALDDEVEPENSPEGEMGVRVNGFIYRANEAAYNAQLDDLEGVDLTPAMYEAAKEAADAWAKVLTKWSSPRSPTERKTVGTARAELERRGQIDHLETRVDTKGRKQTQRKDHDRDDAGRHQSPLESQDNSDDEHVASPEVIERNLRDWITQHHAGAEAARKVVKASHLEGGVRQEIALLVERLISKWKSVQRALAPPPPALTIR